MSPTSTMGNERKEGPAIVFFFFFFWFRVGATKRIPFCVLSPGRGRRVCGVLNLAIGDSIWVASGFWGV